MKVSQQADAFTSSQIAAIASRIEQRLDAPRTPAQRHSHASNEAAFNPYEKAAAVLAWFDPQKINPVGTPLDREEAIDELLDHSTPIRDDERGLRWSLRSDRRVAVLRHLRESGSIEAAIQSNPNAPSDIAQNAVTQALRGAHPPIDELEMGQLRALQQVTIWLGAAGFEDLPSTREISTQIAWRTLLQPFQHLAGQNFRGRVEELRRLREFIGVVPPRGLREQTKRAFNALKQAVLGPSPQFGFLLWGPGGVGKSTLIARLILDHAAAHATQKFPFAYLDFDRPDVDKEEPLAVLAEAVRQFGITYPEAADRLEELRASWLKQLGELVDRDTAIALESRARLRTAAARDAAALLRGIEAGTRPIVLVLDTFEEVQYRGTSAVDILFEQLAFLREAVPALRIVIAGRAEIERKELATHELGAFDEESAMGYLQARGIADASLARMIFQRFGGSPLTLQLAADLAKSGEGADELKTVETRASFLSRAEDGVIQRQLYKRILGHVHCDTVRKLVHPGLVLRRLTPELIKDVLAGPCGLEVASLEQAQILFDAIRREVSLVKLEPDGALRHRQDLRRLMLGLLQRDKPELTQAIHAAAIDFYKDRTGDTERAEEIYHRLWLDQDRTEIAVLWRPSLRKLLFSAIEEFDPPRRAFLAAHLEIEADKEALDAADTIFWETLVARAASDLIEKGLLEDALLRLSERTERTPASTLFELEAKALSRMGRIGEALDRVDAGFRSAASAGLDESSVYYALLYAEYVIRNHDIDRAAEAAERLSACETSQISRPTQAHSIAQLQSVARRVFLAEMLASGEGRLAEQASVELSALLAAVPNSVLAKAPEAAHWAAAAPGADAEHRVLRMLEAVELPRCSDVCLRVCGLALAQFDEVYSQSIAQPAGALSRHFDVPPRVTLIESWTTFVLETSLRRLGEILVEILRIENAPDRRPIVNATRQMMVDALNLRAGASVERNVTRQSSRANPERASLLSRRDLSAAIANAFSPDEFDATLRRRRGTERAAYASGSGPYRTIIDGVVEGADREGWLPELVSLLADSQPNNPQLARIAAAFGLSELSPSLQLVLDHGDGPKLGDVTEWTSRLRQIERVVCRIELTGGTPTGTGFLVGPDLMLTADFIVRENQPMGWQARFDYRSGESGSNHGGTLFQMSGTDIVAAATLGQELEMPYGCALLRIDGSPGAQPVGGLEGLESAAGLRGWIELNKPDHSPRPEQAIGIVHHPKGTPLRVTLGTIVATAPLQYRLETFPGSSGAPIFDTTTLQLIGLHIGRRTGSDIGFGIELGHILSSFEDQGLSSTLYQRFS